MLARRYRITRGSDYRFVVRRGIRSRAAHVVTSVVSTGQARPPRFGFIVSKQVGGAVVRNTVRRRLKAVCAGVLAQVPEGTDVVIRALPSSATAAYPALVADVERGLARARGV